MHSREHGTVCFAVSSNSRLTQQPFLPPCLLVVGPGRLLTSLPAVDLQNELVYIQSGLLPAFSSKRRKDKQGIKETLCHRLRTKHLYAETPCEADGGLNCKDITLRLAKPHCLLQYYKSLKFDHILSFVNPINIFKSNLFRINEVLSS